MKNGGLLILLIMTGSAHAQQAAVIFQPPVLHDLQRYEAGWNKNPFTLKTVPQVVESVSFARDLAIGTYYGDSTDPTIIIVNTKTNERIPLKQNQPSANGMKLGKVTLGAGRKDVVAEVTLATEKAAIRYDDSYVKQIAAAEMTKAPAPQQQTRPQTGTPSSIRLPQTPSPPGTTPATAQTAPVAPGQPGFVPPSGTRHAVNPLPSTPLVSQSTGVNGAPPVPVRRRLIGPALNTTTISQ